MTSGLLSSIAIIAVCLLCYIVFVFFRFRRQLGLFRGRGQQEEAPISEAPLYKETKGPIAVLRAELDSFDEALDHIFARARGGDEALMDAAYDVGIPAMHRALSKAFNAALELREMVVGRPLSGHFETSRVGSHYGAPRKLEEDDGPEETRADRFFGELFKEVGAVAPCIAGFYYALTEVDEKSRKSKATLQAKRIVKHLEQAIIQMRGLEAELAREESYDSQD